MSSSIKFTPTFVQTKNVRSFESMMDGLLVGRTGREHGETDERIGCVYGRAGRGKTRTVQSWAAKHGCVYIETVSVWSELDFLRNICFELDIKKVPHRRGPCFELIREKMLSSGLPIFIDELERFGQKYLEIVRDLVKMTGGIIVLIGEEELPHLMKQNRRTWSRTYRAMEFEPVSPIDIITYVNKCTGLSMNNEAIEVMHKASDGDLRIVRRDTINLAYSAERLGRKGEVDGELARIACQQGLQG